MSDLRQVAMHGHAAELGGSSPVDWRVVLAVVLAIAPPAAVLTALRVPPIAIVPLDLAGALVTLVDSVRSSARRRRLTEQARLDVAASQELYEMSAPGSVPTVAEESSPWRGLVVVYGSLTAYGLSHSAGCSTAAACVIAIIAVVVLSRLVIWATPRYSAVAQRSI